MKRRFFRNCWVVDLLNCKFTDSLGADRLKPDDCLPTAAYISKDGSFRAYDQVQRSLTRKLTARTHKTHPHPIGQDGQWFKLSWVEGLGKMMQSKLARSSLKQRQSKTI